MGDMVWVGRAKGSYHEVLARWAPGESSHAHASSPGWGCMTTLLGGTAGRSLILMSVFPDCTLVAGGCKVTSTQCGNTLRGDRNTVSHT